MSALECDLERVLADERNILDAQLLWLEVLHAGKASWDAGLAPALRTWTGPAKALGRVVAAMAALPRDDHDLAFTVDVDGERKRVRIFQGRAYRTLMTGSCRNDWIEVRAAT